MIRGERLARGDVLGRDSRLPELGARVRPTADLGARGLATRLLLDEGTRAILDDAEQDVEHALGVGLHEPGVAGEHSIHDLAGFFGRELEEHVIGIGDLDEEMRAAARLALLVLARLGLHANSRRIGRDAVRAAERFLAHRLDDGRTDLAADFLEPAAHRAAIDRHTKAREPIFLTV